MSPPTDSAAALAESFRFEAVRADGVHERGDVRADSLDAARDALSARGLFVIALSQADSSFLSRRRPSAADLATGIALLGALLEAGLPLPRALRTLADAAPASWRGDAVRALRAAVREGRPLAAALREADLGLPPHVLGIIAAGEASGRQVAALRQASDLLEHDVAARRALIGALTYPSILFVTGAASVALLVLVVLPRFASILADIGQELPATTQLLLKSGAFARSAALPMVALTTLLVIWWSWRRRTDPSFRRRSAAMPLAVPVLGPLVRRLAASRTGATLAALIAGGVPIATALSHATTVSGNAEIEHRLSLVRTGVIGGEALSAALARTDALTDTFVQFAQAGEAAGELAPLLARGARIEGELAEESLRRMVRFVEPALILLIGSLVAFVAAALLQAVYAVRPV